MLILQCPVDCKEGKGKVMACLDVTPPWFLQLPVPRPGALLCSCMQQPCMRLAGYQSQRRRARLPAALPRIIGSLIGQTCEVSSFTAEKTHYQVYICHLKKDLYFFSPEADRFCILAYKIGVYMHIIIIIYNCNIIQDRRHNKPNKPNSADESLVNSS